MIGDLHMIWQNTLWQKLLQYYNARKKLEKFSILQWTISDTIGYMRAIFAFWNHLNPSHIFGIRFSSRKKAKRFLLEPEIFPLISCSITLDNRRNVLKDLLQCTAFCGEWFSRPFDKKKYIYLKETDKGCLNL